MTTPPPPPSLHTHVAHPLSAVWTSRLPFSPPPPPPPIHTYRTHTHTHTHTDIAQPPRAVLTARLSGLCVCSAQLCRRSGGTMARSPEDCSVCFWEPLHRQCPRDAVFNSSVGAYDWVGNMDCVDSGSDPGVSSTRTTAAKSTAMQKLTTKRIRRFR